MSQDPQQNRLNSPLKHFFHSEFTKHDWQTICDEIACTNLPVGTICSQLGIDDPSQIYRYLHKHPEAEEPYIKAWNTRAHIIRDKQEEKQIALEEEADDSSADAAILRAKANMSRIGIIRDQWLAETGNPSRS